MSLRANADVGIATRAGSHARMCAAHRVTLGGTMNANPYAPPRAEVDDVGPQAAPMPALWNPNAAANWSLLFTPAFGAYLHMKNWQALGQQDKAAAARTWCYSCLAFLCLLILSGAVLPNSKALDGLGRAAGIGLLAAWYFANARDQVKYVKVQLGGKYVRKGWLKPLSLALLSILAVFAALVIVVVLLGAA